LDVLVFIEDNQVFQPAIVAAIGPMNGKRRPFLQAIQTEMRFSNPLKKPAAAETIRRAARHYLFPTGATDNPFFRMFKKA